ncbi:MAG TPA: hypothetical protein VL651_05980, partial [Bacteroidia bacterium]|nr:hypothetical protein [Bacteroidia bacterium]
MKSTTLLVFACLIARFAEGQSSTAWNGNGIGIQDSSAQMSMHVFTPDFSTFAQPNPVITSELDSLTPAALHNNPDYGILPDDAPCTNCIELIDHRTPDSRYYVHNGSGGKIFYVQSSYGNLNYQDSTGWMRAIDPKLRPSTNGYYLADHQPDPAVLNMNDGSTSLRSEGLNFTFNHNCNIFEQVGNNHYPLFNNPDLTTTSVGKNGCRTSNAWPGIDREVIFTNNEVETNYILNAPPPLANSNGWLAFHDEVNLPPGYALVLDTATGGQHNPDGYWQGSLIIIRISTGTVVARWMPAVAYDNSGVHPDINNTAYDISVNGHTYIINALVKESWLLDPATVYPVTVDPLVSGSATWSVAAIGFSIYAPGDGYCGNSSAYCLGGPLNVTFPGQATITNVIWGANYRAFAPAWMSDGGFRMVGPCGEDPVNVDSWYSCGAPFGNASGTCSGSGFNAPWLATCNTPSCVATTVPFRIKNIDCFGWAGPCSIVYLRTVNSTWNVTVQGQTVAHPNPPTSSAGTTICPGACTNLTATGTWGVPPYTYFWVNSTSGATSTSNPYNVCPPNGSTTYTCTITDACGNTAANNVTINATGCLPIELISFTGNYNQNGEVDLNWSTATELNSDHFTLERSTDGIHFDLIGTVHSLAPGGNSTSRLDY